MNTNIATYLISNDGSLDIHRPYCIVSAIAGPQYRLNNLVDMRILNSYNCTTFQNWFDNDEVSEQYMNLLLSLLQDKILLSCINIVDINYLNTTLIVRMMLGDNIDNAATNRIVENLYASLTFKKSVSVFPNYTKEEFEILCKSLKTEALAYVKNNNLSKLIEDNIGNAYNLIDGLKQRNNKDEIVYQYLQPLLSISEFIPKNTKIFTTLSEIDYVREVVAHESISAQKYKVETCSIEKEGIVSIILYNILDRVLTILYSTDEHDIDENTKYATLLVWSLIQKGTIKWIVPMWIFARLKTILNSFVEEIRPST